MSRQPSSQPRCPVCRRPTDRSYRPFCSKRCADVDLNRWLGEAYAVPVVEHDDIDPKEIDKLEQALEDIPNGKLH